MKGLLCSRKFISKQLMASNSNTVFSSRIQWYFQCAMQVCGCISERCEELNRASVCFLFTAGVPVPLLCSMICFSWQLFCLPAAPACRLMLNGPLAVLVVLVGGDWFAETSFTWAFDRKGVDAASKHCQPLLLTSMLKSSFRAC